MSDTETSSTPLLSHPKKGVSFNPTLTTFSSPPSPSSPSPSSPTCPSTAKPIPPPFSRRRSSLKEGGQMPQLPDARVYQHSDPLLRRLRLRDGYGEPVELRKEFGAECKVVLFLFGATWPGSSRESFLLVEQFAKAHPHRLKVVYCSVDSSENNYVQNTRGKSYLSMEWNDGSNADDDSPTPLPLPLPEPFLLASSPDLESDLAHSDTSGTLYLRPYSRVHLSQKWAVLGVPSVFVYHVEKGEVIGRNVRLDCLRKGQGEKSWEKWEKGERVTFQFGELVHALRWTLTAGAVAAAYLVAVRVGGVEDVVGNLSRQLTMGYLGGGQ